MERQPPFDKSAERSVIGSILRDNGCLIEITELLGKQAFYFDAHQKIFGTIVKLFDEKQPIDLVILADRIKDQGFVEDIGGYDYLGSLWDCAPIAANAIYYAKIVQEKALARDLIQTCSEAIKNLYDPVGPADDVLNELQRDLLKLGNNGKSGESKKLSDIVREFFQDLDKKAKCGTIGVPSGLIDLDDLTSGFHANEFIVLAARPSVGKTALAGNICRRAAAAGHASLIFSIEQSRLELCGRWFAGESDITTHQMRKVRLSGDQVQRLTDVGKELSPLPIWINDTPSMNARRILGCARRLMATEPIKLIVVDYLQIMQLENGGNLSMTDKVGNAAKSLKQIARELKVPVLCLSQLSRDIESRENKRPRLSDLRASGDIEQVADTVMFLYRPNAVVKEEPTEVIEVCVEKQRNGPLGNVPLTYVKRKMVFENYSPGVPQ